MQVVGDLNAVVNDEYHNYLNGSVNKQNFCNWAPENPRNNHEIPSLQYKSVTVGRSVTPFCVMAKCFCEENNAMVTVEQETLSRYPFIW